MKPEHAHHPRHLVVVSNRLPVEQSPEGEWRTAPGGLVTALQPVVQEHGGLWVGWPGQGSDTAIFEHEGMRLAPVPLSAHELEEYYEGFSNATLWPLYHDVIVHPQFHRGWWGTYRDVNARFARTVAEHAEPHSFVWVHDYQLQLVPEILRELRPDLTIGFFLHIPFPAPGLFAQLPWRAAIIRGMLGADLVGFQREADAAHFRTLAAEFAGAHVTGDVVTYGDEDRDVLVRAFPISIDAQAIESLARTTRMQEEATRVRETFAPEQTLLLGIDRLDYTKGILHRLKAFEELLRAGELDLHEAVLIQVASPSREQVREYQDIREEVEATVGRINGTYGTLDYTPVVYLHRGHTHEETVSLFLAANVLVVTSLRDGMNLVAKEYVACRSDEQGVLVLSEFAGAADEFPESVLVNPHDVEGLKSAMLRAIHMPQDEQRRRMRRMRETVFERDVAHWTQSFMNAIGVRIGDDTSTREPLSESATAIELLEPDTLEAVRRLARHPQLIVASDVDGTLSPIVSTPDHAWILPEALQALDRLQSLPETPVILVSGRSVEGVSRMLRGDEGLAVSLAISGSHGGELAPGKYGTLVSLTANSMLDGALTTEERETRGKLVTRVRRLVAEEPGVRLEEKPLGIAVHVRRVADRERAAEILEHVVAARKIDGVFQRDGKAVREFSVREVDKGSALALIREAFPDAPLIYIGDDLTDEDVFTSLREGDLGVKVGDGPTAAHVRVRDPYEVTALLTVLAAERGA